MRREEQYTGDSFPEAHLSPGETGSINNPAERKNKQAKQEQPNPVHSVTIRKQVEPGNRGADVSRLPGWAPLQSLNLPEQCLAAICWLAKQMQSGVQVTGVAGGCGVRGCGVEI